ncbi:Eukaryotic translation initiation factor 4B [Collariella sp. IMI 366227]|nr:Eukaryotic translation initiation factor 4B [Collariella sp. IMI 366227]
MAPKKKQEVQKLSLGDFLADNSFGGGSWADEVEDTYGYHSLRDNLPQELPTKPPFTAHLGNLSYDATVETVTEFFEDCNISNVRIIEDRELNRPKGFAYAEFADLEGLKTALTRDGQTFQGRGIRVKVAEPPRGGFERTDSFRELDWGAKRGPLADLPGRGGDRRGPGGPDFGERRREFQPSDDGKSRDFGNWERRGPLSPLPQQDRPESREGSRARTVDARSGSFRGTRGASPAAWGPGEGRQEGSGSRPPRREFADRPERPERAPTAAEKDFNWRNNMRPGSVVKSPSQSQNGSAPPSPAPAAALPVGRPKLNLTKRTVSEATTAAPASASGDSKASPFGAARPIDTAAREREVEEKRVKEKKEAEEKAQEEKLAKEAAAKEAAEKAAEKAAADKAAAEEAAKAKEAKEEAAAEEAKAAPQEGAITEASDEQKPAARAREPREPREPREAPKSRANESGNWRSEPRASRGAPSGPRRGAPARGPRDAARPPRANGSGSAPSQPQSPSTEEPPATPTVDEDGWTTVTVPVKGRRGQSGRP